MDTSVEVLEHCCKLIGQAVCQPFYERQKLLREAVLKIKEVEESLKNAVKS